jgi:hypothetical protein
MDTGRAAKAPAVVLVGYIEEDRERQRGKRAAIRRRNGRRVLSEVSDSPFLVSHLRAVSQLRASTGDHRTADPDAGP